MLELYKSVLEDQGLKPVVAETVSKALSLLNSQEIDLVLSDLVMPEINGYQFFEMVRSSKDLQHIPFVFISGNASESDRLAGLNMGADDFVTKTISPKEVVLRIKGILSRLRKIDKPALTDTSLSGRLEEGGISDLLQFLASGKRTGHLIVSSETVRGEVWFKNGRPSCAKSVEHEKEEAIYDLMLISDGAFFFSDKKEPPKSDITTDLFNIILEGARRIDEIRAGYTPGQQRASAVGNVLLRSQRRDHDGRLGLRRGCPRRGAGEAAACRGDFRR